MDDGILVFALDLTNRFRGVTRREGLLVPGPAGWGEFAPFLDYAPSACTPWLAAAREAASHPFPAPVRRRVPVNCTVPAVGPERAAAIVARSGGCRTAKVKVAEAGQTLRDDLDRVAAVRDAIGSDGRIRIDANAAWERSDAIGAIRALHRAAKGIEYVEQPCADVDDLAAVRRAVPVPIAADESIRLAENPFDVVRRGAADIAVLKVGPLGGVSAALRMAERLELPAVVSSALDTSIGLQAGLALAAALPELPYACGLGTGRLLDGDVTSTPLRTVDGSITVPGTRIVPDLLSAGSGALADPTTRARWIRRLADTERAAA
ncbi:MAG: o-succinylbenzoate synthase [Microthrixaceae bacterium]